MENLLKKTLFLALLLAPAAASARRDCAIVGGTRCCNEDGRWDCQQVFSRILTEPESAATQAAAERDQPRLQLAGSGWACSGVCENGKMKCRHYPSGIEADRPCFSGGGADEFQTVALRSFHDAQGQLCFQEGAARSVCGAARPGEQPGAVIQLAKACDECYNGRRWCTKPNGETFQEGCNGVRPDNPTELAVVDDQVRRKIATLTAPVQNGGTLTP